MGGACGTHGGEEKYIQVWWRKLMERERLEELGGGFVLLNRR